MNAIRFYGPNNLKYEQVDIKEPNDDEILVKVKAALTCGTDIKTFRRGHPVLIKEIPSGFGHEFSGIVEKTGKKHNSPETWGQSRMRQFSTMLRLLLL